MLCEHDGVDASRASVLLGTIQKRLFGPSLGLIDIACADGGHNVSLEIASSLPSNPPVYKPYMRGIDIAL